MKLLFFASCADSAGLRAADVELRATPRDIVAHARDLFRSQDMENIRVAVNKSWAEWSTPLNDGDEVAFMPPVSGG